MTIIGKRLVLLITFFVLSPLAIWAAVKLSTNQLGNLPKADRFAGAPQNSTVAEYSPLVNQSGMILGVTISSADATPVLINKYLKRYQSPIPGDKLIESAKKCNVNPKLMVAIAQQETNLGKHMPKDDCINAWGYGVHKSGTLCFPSWEEAFDSVFCGIAKNYCAKGLCEDPCLMMKKYTPSSNGSWCFGVNQFLAELETGEF